MRRTRPPVLFVGHGSPRNAIEDNAWSRGFAALGRGLKHPAAVLCVSAHWYTDGTWLSANERPRTIHDFGGFPDALYEVRYPAPGDPALAARARRLLGAPAALSDEWGLDHGAWSVLLHVFPEADVPVVQLSIDRRLAPREHFELARRLRPLREEGVLIVGSGNVTHDLRDAFARLHSGDLATPDWAARFDATVAAALRARDTETLLALWPDTADGRRCHPTPDHWLPLLYAYGATDDFDAATFPIEGFDLGSLSMRSAWFA